MFENKKIFILGMARSGYEVAKVLVSHGNDVTINDGKEQDENQVKELNSLGVKVITGHHPEDAFDNTFDYLIKNPGIRNDHQYVLMANQMNIPVLNEMEVAFSLMPADVKIVGITGTNGKTTTTTLIYEFLKSTNKKIHLTGNIGYPLCSFLKDINEGDIVVCEVSVQQMCNFQNFKTDISVLTNLSEAHLDFVGTYENYKNIKKRIFNHHNRDNLAVINFDDPDSLELTEDIRSTKYYFGHEKGLAYLENDKIIYKDEVVLDVGDIILKGIHNYENIMAAIIVAKEFNVTNAAILEVLKAFKGVEHRLEFVRELNGRKFYNDSKATNNKSTEIALKTFTTPTIILMGGLNRGIPFDELAPFMNHVKLIVCYGETKDILVDFANRQQIKVLATDELKDATILAYRNSSAGDTILLSPACASWDQFKKFEDRGDLFKSVVLNIE